MRASYAKGRLWPHLIAIACYLGLALGLTWPMASSFTHAIASAQPIKDYLYASPEDGIQNVWNVWWSLQALRAGQNPFWTDLLFFPDGVQLYVQTLGLVNFLPMLPLAALFGPVAGFNAAMLLAMAATGYAGFLLARFVTPHLGLALLCGFLLTASPLHMFKLQIHQLNLISLQWLTLYLLALLHLERRPGWRTVIATVGTVFLLMLSDWYWLLIALISTLPWAVTALLRSAQRSRLLRALVGVVLGSLLVMLPLLFGIYQARDRLPPAKPHNLTWYAYIEGFSADALGLLAPNILHPLWGEQLWRLSRPIQSSFAIDGWYVALGWVLLVCAMLGLPELWRRQQPLAVMGLVTWMLSLGPGLQIAYQPTGIPLPYALIQDLPLVQLARRPSLFSVVVLLVAIVAAALGLQRLISGQTVRRGKLILGGVSILALVELMPPGPAQRQLIMLDPPALMSKLQARPGAVADLPFVWVEDSRTLLNQIGHGQSIIGGYVARRPDYPALRYSPLLNAIARLQRLPIAEIVPLDHRALQAMQCAYPLRHILLFQPEVEAEQVRVIADLAAELAGTPIKAQAAGDYLWYELPVPTPPCAPFASLGSGWDFLEHDASTSWRWIGEEAELTLVNPRQEALRVELRLGLEAFANPRQVELQLNDIPQSIWQVSAGGPRIYHLRLRLEPGVQRVRLRASTSLRADTRMPRWLSLRAFSIEVREVERAPARP